MVNGRNGDNKASGRLPLYDKGYRDGYMEGLSECGPLAGFTKWFSRRAKSKKLGKMKEGERHAVVVEAIAQYEAEGEGAKERLLGNPTKKQHLRIAKYWLAEAQRDLRQAKKAKSRDQQFSFALFAVADARAGMEHLPDPSTSSAASQCNAEIGKVGKEAEKLLRKIARVANPSEAGAAALGGVAGGLLLGPIGAAAGGYTGVKLRKRAEGKKAARTRARRKAAKRRTPGSKTAGSKRNPKVGRLVRDALK